MKSGQQIEQIEKELQELLQSVMQAPLSPLTHTLQNLQSHLDEVEDLVKEIKNEDLIALSLNSQDTEKQIKSLKSSIEGTPRDIQEALHPLLQQELKSLEQSHQANIGQLQSDLKKSTAENDRQLLSTTQSLAERISAVSTSVEALQAALAAQSQQASSSLDQAAQTLTIQISEQSASISELQATLKKQTEQAEFVLEKVTRELAVKISAMVELAAQQQTALTVQSEQLSRLQKQQSEAHVKLAEQAQRLLQPMRRWLATAVVVAGLGLLGTMALVAHQFY